MLRLVNLNLADSLAFADDPGWERPSDDELLPRFLSTRRRNIAKLDAPECYGAFAERFGSLTGTCGGVAIPRGAMALMADLGGLKAEGAVLHVEPRALWRFHVDAMRDIAMLHAFSRHAPARRKTNGVRLLRDSCVVYEDGRGGLACLYHGANGLHPDMRWPGRAPARVPSDVAAYLDAAGAGFAFAAPYRADGDTPEGREEWLESNADAVIAAYLNSYLASFPGEEGTLLAELQSALVDLVGGPRPLTFCILCGGAATKEVEAYTLNFDSNACRALFYRIRDELADVLVRDGGYTEVEAAAMIDTSRGGYRAKA